MSRSFRSYPHNHVVLLNNRKRASNLNDRVDYAKWSCWLGRRSFRSYPHDYVVLWIYVCLKLWIYVCLKLWIYECWIGTIILNFTNIRNKKNTTNSYFTGWVGLSWKVNSGYSSCQPNQPENMGWNPISLPIYVSIPIYAQLANFHYPKIFEYQEPLYTHNILVHK